MKQRKKAKQNKIDSKDLFFISDIPLRNKIVNAIETISFLYLVEKDEKYSTELSKEIRRVIVLYAASIIEAALLYLYKKGEFSILKIEYKNVYTLPQQYQQEKDTTIVVAKQMNIQKNDRELMLDVLLKLFSDEKLIPPDLEGKIKKAKDVRNTFHLSKSRLGLQSSPKTVTLSTEAIYETILIVKKYLE